MENIYIDKNCECEYQVIKEDSKNRIKCWIRFNQPRLCQEHEEGIEMLFSYLSNGNFVYPTFSHKIICMKYCDENFPNLENLPTEKLHKDCTCDYEIISVKKNNSSKISAELRYNKPLQCAVHDEGLSLVFSQEKGYYFNLFVPAEEICNKFCETYFFEVNKLSN